MGVRSTFYNSTVSSPLSLIIAQVDIASKCTMKLTHNEFLQRMVSDTDGVDYENRAYATQCECPEDMSPLQYLEFARIRVGGGLQQFNLVRAIFEHFDFTSPHAFTLLQQALWQVGPMSAEGLVVSMNTCLSCILIFF